MAGEGRVQHRGAARRPVDAPRTWLGLGIGLGLGLELGLELGLGLGLELGLELGPGLGLGVGLGVGLEMPTWCVRSRSRLARSPWAG